MQEWMYQSDFEFDDWFRHYADFRQLLGSVGDKNHDKFCDHQLAGAKRWFGLDRLRHIELF